MSQFVLFCQAEILRDRLFLPILGYFSMSAKCWSRRQKKSLPNFTEFYRYRKTLPPFCFLETAMEVNREPRQPREREG